MAAPSSGVRRQYDDTDKYKVYMHWLSVDKVKKQTARECNISLSTLKHWVADWEDGKIPPEPSEEELARIDVDRDVLPDLKDIRGMALDRIKLLIPNSTSIDHLARIVQQTSERIDRSEGLAPNTGDTNVTVNLRLENARGAAEAMLGLASKALDDAAMRTEEIYDATESLELPAGNQASAAEGGTD